jgi:hypothetical protein
MYEQPPALKKRSTGLVITLVIVGSLVGLCAVCGVVSVIASSNDNAKIRDVADAKSTRTTSDASSQIAAAPATSTDTATAKVITPGKQATTPETQAPGLNMAVRDGKFEFVVKSVNCGKTSVGSQYLNKKAQGQFCTVTMSVKNIGSKPQTFFLDNQKVTTNGGAECAPDSIATMYVLSDSGGQSTWINEINPGNQISGPIVYDIPTDAKIAKLKLHDSMFSNGVTVTVT